MADNLPMLDEDAPILSDQPILSKQSGDDVIGDAFGKASQQFAGVAETLEDRASKAGLYSAQANLQNLKSSANALIAQNPDQATNINQQTQNNSSIILKNAYVNDADRAQLNKDIAASMGSLDVAATRAQVRSNNAAQAFSFMKNYPSMLKGYADAVITNKPLADSQANTFYQTLQGLVTRGVIKPTQAYDSFIKPVSNIHDNAQSLMDNRENISSAADYHTANYNPTTNDPTNLPGTPYNEGQATLAAHTFNDVSYRGIVNKTTQPGYSLQDNPQDMISAVQFRPGQFEQIQATQSGAAKAYGMITSNAGYPAIIARYDDLKHSPKGTLNDSEKGEYLYYKNYFDGLSNGDTSSYLKLTQNTAMGANITQDLNDKLSALQSNQNADPVANAKFSQKIINDHITQMGAVNHNMPFQLVQPIPQNIVAPIQSGFQQGGNVQDTVTNINYLSPFNQGYLQNALRKPNQQLTARMVGEMGDGVPVNFSQNLVRYNQEGLKFPDLKQEEGTSDNSLTMKIISNPDVQNISKFLQLQDGGAGMAQALPGVVQNYVKGISQQNGDLNLKDSDSVIDDSINNIKRGYNIVTGKNYVFNDNDMHLTQGEYDAIGDYGAQEGAKAIINKGYSASQISTGNFMTTMTADDQLKIFFNGTYIGKIPYDANLLPKINNNNSMARQRAINSQGGSPLAPGFQGAQIK